MHTIKLNINGMKCQHCVQNVTQALNKLGDITATVSLEQASATIESDKAIDTDRLVKVIEAAGYKATPAG